MKLLYFASTSFYQKPNPSFHLMYAMISDLLERGDSIYFVGPKLNILERHIPPEFINHRNFHYRLILKKIVNKNDFKLRYFNGIKYAYDSAKYLKEFMPYCDVVFVQSSPTMLYNVCIAKHYVNQQKIVMNVQDMFPGSSIASGVMSQKWMQKIFFYLQKIAYKKADVIVGISEDMRDKIIEQGVPIEKTDVILNWFDDRSVHQVDWDKNRFVKKYNMNPLRFYVQYAGTMGFVFDYKMIVHVAEILKEYPNIEFQMIGTGSQKDDFIKMVRDKRLNNITFLPLEPQSMVSDVYSACSVCLIPLKHGVIGNSVPSKAGLLMECHKPIITSSDKGCKYLKEIEQNEIGIACSDDNPNSVANAILDLYNNPSKCKQMGEKGYNYGHRLYSRTYNMDKYIKLFLSLCEIKNK